MRLKEGDLISCKLEGVEIPVGLVVRDGERLYICHNAWERNSYGVKIKGFLYSWCIGNGCEEHLRICGNTDIKLLNRKVYLDSNGEEIEEGEEVYVYQIENNDMRIFLAKIGNIFICVNQGDEEKYKKGNNDFKTTAWYKVYKEPKPKTIKIKFEGRDYNIDIEKAEKLGLLKKEK